MGEYQEALEAFQLGVAWRVMSTSAGSLGRWLPWVRPLPMNLDYLGQQEDLERAERYDKIWRSAR
jgi:hypothetical protein